MFSWCTSISTSYFRSNLIPNWATLHVGTEHHLPPPSARQGSTSTFPPSRTNTSWESPRKLGCNHAPIWMDMGILCVYIYIHSIYIIDIVYIYIYDGLSKCLFPVLLINRNSMRAASCLPLKNMTYLDDVKTWKFFVAFGNLSKTTGIG